MAVAAAPVLTHLPVLTRSGGYPGSYPAGTPLAEASGPNELT